MVFDFVMKKALVGRYSGIIDGKTRHGFRGRQASSTNRGWALSLIPNMAREAAKIEFRISAEESNGMTSVTEIKIGV